MAVYTLSLSFIDGVTGNQSHLHNVFLKFSNPECEHKAAMDKSKRLLQLYIDAASKNVDLNTWLDWMSRRRDAFEQINISISNAVSEEEMYLMIAAATKAHKKIIVDNHQCYPSYNYLSNCNKVVYNSHEILILSKEEAYQELNSTNNIIQTIKETSAMKKNNPWISGSFYLFSFVIIFVLIALSALYLPPLAIPIVIIGCLLLFSIIGASQLRNDDRLSQKSFLQLMGLTFKQIRFIGANKNEENQKSNNTTKR
jgi:hypothetical protein